MIRRRRRALATVLLALLLASAATAEDPRFVWWEGEDPAETNFPDRSWFSADTFADRREEVLSGGDWLSNSGNRDGPEAFARYRIRVPAKGEYALWTRKFWKHGPFRWRFDDGEWRTCGRDIGLADNVTIRTNLCANWVSLGNVELTKGRHTFELRLLAGPGEALTACFDCFLLTADPFSPRGTLRPGEISGRAEPGWFPVEPPPDPFEESPIDLRRLNEAEAGVNGHVRRQGDHFILGDKTPVRFWAVNCGPDVARLGDDAVDRLARRLAKEGVNMVRFHGALFDRSAKDPTALDLKLLDRLHYFVAAMKREGIYTFLSFYFPLWFDIRPEYGIPGYDTIENRKPFALLFFDERMQKIWRAWAKGVLGVENPYTGLALKDDPALAILEIVNEDSYLFHTFRPGVTIPLVLAEKLERAFAAWLRKRYGLARRLFSKWGGPQEARDDPDGGRMTLFPAWNLTADGHGEGARKKRMSDQLRFLVEHQRLFYDDTIEWLREEAGLEALVSCSNWHTADARLLDALERYTYTAGDLIDRHGYFGGRHQGEGSNYSVRTGHTYADRSALRNPEALPLFVNQVEGYPHTISEVGWPNPNRFRADFPFLAAAYGALTGIDGIFFFAVRGPGFSTGTEKFPADVPTVRGQFPACALLYRRGDLPEGKPVVRENLTLDALYEFRGSSLVSAPALDQLRSGGRPEDGAMGRIDPLAFLVGRVVRVFGAKHSVGLDRTSRCIDRTKKQVTGGDGSLVLDYGKGVITLDTPTCQGASGFLDAAGPLPLSGVTIECGNEYATVMVVSLDGKPLGKSGQLLIQAVTEEKPWGFSAEGGRITEVGSFPLLVREIDATVTIKGGARFRKVQALDLNGLPKGRLSTRKRRTDLTIELPPDGLYTLAE